MARRAPAQSITSVGRPLSEDVHGRAVRYLISMTIRTACLVGIFFTDGWLQWVLAAGAIFVPYFAVMAANAGRERPTQADTLIERPQLEAPPASQQGTPHTGSVPIDLRGGYLR